MPADGTERDVVAMMAERDAALRAERERQRKADTLIGPSAFGDTLQSVIAKCAEVCVASDEELAALDARAEREAWRERLEASGIHESTRIEDRRMLLEGKLEPLAALRATQGWLAKATDREAPGRNVLVMAGATGLGKTLAAAWAITREGGIYVKMDELCRDYARWERDRTTMDHSGNAWRRYQRARLVVLDEVGRERDANLARDAFYKLVDERQSRRRQLTIMVTNLSRADFLARLHAGAYDERSASRLARDAWVVPLDGKDLRR
jgi:DNA replication protein DnaC